MRTINLKFIGMALFVFVFLVGGFFINSTKVSAVSTTPSFSYSLSTITSYTNSEKGTSTIMRVGCLPGSGDIYDINSGKLCSYITSTTKIGCAPKSGDKYDVNTGALCLYGVSNVRIGCAVGSLDKYDINTGNVCTNKYISVNSTPQTQSPQTDTVTTKTQEGPGEVSVTDGKPTIKEDEILNEIEEPFLNDKESGQERMKTIFTWPPTVQAILLAIIVLLALGYGIYRLFKKNDNTLEFAPKNDKNKSAPVNPVVSQPQSNQPKTTVTPQAPGAPVTPQQPNTPSSTTASTPNTPNNSNPQGQTPKKG